MDWKDVAKIIAPLAPTLGGFLGGFIPFPGGGAAGQLLGTLIAKQFGVPATPEAVHQAVTTSPNDVAIAKINAAAREAEAQWPAIAEMEKARQHFAEVQVSQVNETARAELAVESKFKSWWRPAHGWLLIYELFVISNLAFAGLVLAAFGKPLLIETMAAVWPLLAAVLGFPAAVVGVAVWSRGSEKIEAIKLGVPMPGVKPPLPPAKPAVVKR